MDAREGEVASKARWCLQGHGDPDGLALLKRLHEVITQTSAEKIAALHARFAEPKPCPNVWVLSKQLTEWGRDLKELHEAGAPPSVQTVTKSLKTLVKGIEELKKPLDILDLVAPGSLAAQMGAVTASNHRGVGARKKSLRGLVTPKKGLPLLHRSGAILLRSALTSGHFATFCMDLVPFCSALHRFGAIF